MDNYIDIWLRPDPEFRPDMLMSALYAKLHRALVRHERGDIGISFPDVRDAEARLGDRLRLHGQMGTLNTLMASAWLTGMRDYVSVGDTLSVPADTQHRIVKRVQAKSNAERLRRRLMRRHGHSERQALAQIPDSVTERLSLPSLHLNSASTDQVFPMFIQHGPLQGRIQAGRFNTYGLSAGPTIPWF